MITRCMGSRPVRHLQPPSRDLRRKSTPEGSTDAPVNPLALAIVSGATFVARGFAGDLPGLTVLMTEAMNHKGFAVLDVLQPCVTFDKIHTYQWYRPRLYKLDGTGYVPDNKLTALRKPWSGVTKYRSACYIRKIGQRAKDWSPRSRESR